MYLYLYLYLYLFEHGSFLGETFSLFLYFSGHIPFLMERQVDCFDYLDEFDQGPAGSPIAELN